MQAGLWRTGCQIHSHHSVLKHAKIECCKEESPNDLRRSECILSAALKTRSTLADDAGAEKYCLAILVRRGQRGSLAEIGAVAKMKERLRQAIGGSLHQ